MDESLKKLISTLEKSDDMELNYVLTFLMSEKNSLFTSLYSIFSMAEIYRLVMLYGGSTMKIPKIEDFKEILNTFIAYYYKEIKNQSWEEIVAKFPNIVPLRETKRIKFIKQKLKTVNLDKIKDFNKLILS